MKFILDHRDQLSDEISTFWFKGEPLNHLAGQYLELSLPHDNPDERGIKRWFTISASPTEPNISITTRFSPSGSTFKNRLNTLVLGEEVDITGPMGDFVLPKDPGRPILLVAGGIGITPIRSMVKWLTDTHERRDIHVIYAAQNESRLVFKDDLENYLTGIEYVIAEPRTSMYSHSGELDAIRICELANDIKSRLVYLSGPEPLIENLNKGLISMSVEKDQIVTDFFPGYTAI